MNGENTRNKALSRKDFLWYMTVIAGAGITLPQFIACEEKKDHYAHIGGRIYGASAAVGHKLRGGTFPPVTHTLTVDAVIVGSGVAGLTAARALQQKGVSNFKVLELEEHPGGNAGSGKNAYSAYPLGAHYLPIPNLEDKPLLDLLQEAGMLTGYAENGLPIYNETDLRFDPEERLFINGRWQSGLVPQFGASTASQEEFKRFFAAVEKLRWERGGDGLYAFDIPVAHSSKDAQYRQLDSISMQAYLQQEGYKTKELFWYLDYCCRDDFGAGAPVVSAWAGLHYFAGRKGKAANAEPFAVLTWPQGNGRLVQHLQQFSKDNLLTNALAFRINPVKEGVAVDYLDVITGTVTRIMAKACIMATPQFVTRRLLPGGAYDHSFVYSPWLVANLTLDPLPPDRGFPLSWDNVFYNSRSLGYVNAQQQWLPMDPPAKQVLTYYLPLDQLDPADSRRYALGLDHAHWVKLITDDLETVHPGIRDLLHTVDVWVWGHGMIRPHVGFITSDALEKARQSGFDNIFLAHSDLSGISIFEEAFYHGNNAAAALLAHLHA